jgi:hypothetical protein
MCACFILILLLYYNYSCIYLYKFYASYIHISRGDVKHNSLRTTAIYCSLPTDSVNL